MTKFTCEIFEKYQIRKTRRQKAAFRKRLTGKLLAMGFPVGEERHGLSAGTVNVTVGDPDKAEVLFTAHYDTCARMPFPNFITPRRPLLFWSIQILLAVVLVLLAMFLQWAAYVLTESTPFSMGVYFGFLLLFILLLIIGPANRHTANDNTSGVCLLCEALQALTPEQLRKSKTAFVFFDNEEKGLIGSSYYKRRHKKAVQNQTVINFDCVGDGDHLLFICSKELIKDTEMAARLSASVVNHPERVNTVCASKGVVYPSDQKLFRKSAAVAAFHHNRAVGLYLGRIHTRRDTVMDEANEKLLQAFIENMVQRGSRDV